MSSWTWPGFDVRRELSPEEAAELSARVAELTRAGLPLGSGLRALADELASRRLTPVLRGLADRLEAGDDLAAALHARGQNLPAHLRGLMLAGVRSGRLTEVLEEFVDIQQRQGELRRRVWLSLAYPCILSFFLVVLLVLAKLSVINGFASIFRDFGTELPDLTLFVLQAWGPLTWLAAGLLAAAIGIPLLLWAFPGAGWIWRVAYWVPMLGPLLRWSHLAEFARLLGMLLEQQVALPDALRLCGAGLYNADLARGCRQAADDVAGGRPLDESLAARRQFPPSLVAVVRWGQQAPAVADAFRAGAEMLEGRARSQGALLEAVLLPIMFLVIVTAVGVVVTALLLPFIRLLQPFHLT